MKLDNLVLLIASIEISDSVTLNSMSTGECLHHVKSGKGESMS